MSYLTKMTEMIADSKTIEQERLIYDIHEMVMQMIEELTPQVIKEVLEREMPEIRTNIRTTLNGKNVEIKDIKDVVEKEISRTIKK